MNRGSAADVLVSDGKLALHRHISQSTQVTPSSEAFVSWALRNQTPLRDLGSLFAASAARIASDRDYHDVAVLGFARHSGQLTAENAEAFRKGITWLVGRKPIVDGEPMGFCLDGAALVGIALGTGISGQGSEIEVSTWFASFLRDSYELPAIGDSLRCLLAAIDQLLHLGLGLVIPDSPTVADVRTFLRACSLWSPVADTERQRDELATVLLLRTQDVDSLNVVEAAMRLQAVRWIERSAPNALPGQASVDDVFEVLRHVPEGLRRWTWEKRARTRGGQERHWHIDHEYHVQNLLYFLLAPIFPDLSDEQYTQAVGQKQPRSDLFIPSLRLIIEVKFMHRADRPQKIIGEIAEDASLYLAEGSDYSGVVAFVWDDSCRTEEHGKLVEGLKKIRGIVDAILVSRPGHLST